MQELVAINRQALNSDVGPIIMIYGTVCNVIFNVYGIMKLHRIIHGTLGRRNKRFDYLIRMCRRIR